MKLTPASRALPMIRAEVDASVGPPNIMVPRQIGEIFRPLRPSERYCMREEPFEADGDRVAGSSRRCELPDRRKARADDGLREEIQNPGRGMVDARVLRAK